MSSRDVQQRFAGIRRFLTDQIVATGFDLPTRRINVMFPDPLLHDVGISVSGGGEHL